MSRVTLADISSLTFYKDAKTKARRLPPVPQLTCIGQPCRVYQPDAIRCTNSGGEGIDIDWKCEADLPESLRFGKVDVSCEGWNYAGDEYVLKGSCALEYRLVRIPQFGESYAAPSSWSSRAFMFAWISVLLFILYRLLKSCLERAGHRHDEYYGPDGRHRPPAYPSGPTGPPPPYNSPSNLWSPGNGSSQSFWTGLGLGGLGATAAAHYLGRRSQQPQVDRRLYDWEPEPRRERRPDYEDDRGVGSSSRSSLRSEPTRRSVAYGRTSVR